MLEQRARDKCSPKCKNAEEANWRSHQDKRINTTCIRSGVAHHVPGADGIVQGYNAQAAVEPTLLLIVGQTVTEASNDKRQLKPMVELIEQQSGQSPSAPCRQRILFGGEPGKFLASADKPEHKIEGFIATGKQKHGRLSRRADPCRGMCATAGRSNEAEAADQGG